MAGHLNFDEQQVKVKGNISQEANDQTNIFFDVLHQ